MVELNLDKIERTHSYAINRDNNPECEDSLCRKMLTRNDEIPFGLIAQNAPDTKDYFVKTDLRKSSTNS